MKKEHVKSKYNEALGKAKEKVGDETDEKKLNAEGRLQQVKAKAQKAKGDVKDFVDDI